MNFICVAVIQFIVLIQQTWCCCISCSNAYNCIGIKDIGNNDQVNFNGYRAGTYANISAGGSGRIQCFGSHTTLQSTLSASSHIQVGGTNSASNSTLSTNSELRCSATKSCSFSIISKAGSVSALGDQSCSFTTITGTAQIGGMGQFSLTNSTIYSVSETNILCRGWKSCFNIVVNCGEHHSCNIECYGNACHNLKCIGFTYGCNITHLYSYNNNINKPSNEFVAAAVEDNTCNIASIAYDNSNERKNTGTIIISESMVNNISSLCCRGRSSCQAVGNIEYNGTKSVVCSGEQSCRFSSINSAHGDVHCEGWNSCRETQIITQTGDIYCSGDGGCELAIITTGGSVFCNAWRSCKGTVITSFGDGSILNVYFRSYFARGQETNITCQKNDICNIYVDVVADHESTESVGYIICKGECHVCCQQDYYCPNILSNLTTFQSESILNPTTVCGTSAISPTQVFNPTISPTQTFNATITVIFVVTFEFNLISPNTTNVIIRELLRNLTLTIVENDMHFMNDICYSNNIAIDVNMYDNNTAIITGGINVCSNNDSNILVSYFYNNLTITFINKIDENVKLILIGDSVTLNVNIIDSNQKMTTTKLRVTHGHTNVSHDIGEPDDFTFHSELYLLIGAGLIAALCVLFCVCFITKTIKKNKISTTAETEGIASISMVQTERIQSGNIERIQSASDVDSGENDVHDNDDLYHQHNNGIQKTATGTLTGGIGHICIDCGKEKNDVKMYKNSWYCYGCYAMYDNDQMYDNDEMYDTQTIQTHQTVRTPKTTQNEEVGDV
eukprot:303806_1